MDSPTVDRKTADDLRGLSASDQVKHLVKMLLRIFAEKLELV